MSALDLLDDYRVAHIELRLSNGQPLHLDCVVRAINPPIFEATFLPDVLPLTELDLDGKCKVAFECGGPTYTLEARIEKADSPERLLLVELTSFTHVQKRAFFRVDAETEVHYCVLCDDGCERNGEVEMAGVTARGRVNLSAGGIRFPVEQPLPSGQRLLLEIRLERRRVRGIGRVVRMLGGGEEPLQVAVEFDDLDADARDSIMAFCFADQRRQLRLKVQLLGR